MNRLFAIVGKEMRTFASDPQQLFFSFLMPLAIIAMMVGAFGGGQQLNVTGYVVDLDRTAQSADLIARIEGVEGLAVRIMDQTEAAARLERSDIGSYLVIPAGFGVHVEAGDVSLGVNRRGNGGTEGQIFMSYVVAEASEMAAQVRQHKAVLADLEALGLAYDPATVAGVLADYRGQAAEQPRVEVVTESFGKQPEGAAFFLPGIVSMFALFTVALASENVLDERKNGTLERLMTTRLTRLEMITGKFMAFASRTFVQLLILFLVGWAWFKLFTPSGFAQVILFSVAVAAAGAALGLLIASIARSKEQAIWGSVIYSNLAAMIGGSFVAVDSNSVVGKIGRFTLNHYANAGYRAMIGSGLGFESPAVRTNFLILLAIAAGLLLLAVPAFKMRRDG